MSDTDEKVVKPFSTFLIEQRNGALAAELGEALHELVEAVTETSKAGSLTLTIKIKPEGAVLFVSDDVKVKAPAAERTASIFYADEHANLSRKDPRQPELPLAEVPRPAANA